MAEALIALLVTIIVVAIIVAVIVYCIGLLPVDDRFRQLIIMLVYLLAAVIILFKALPILGVSL